MTITITECATTHIGPMTCRYGEWRDEGRGFRSRLVSTCREHGIDAMRVYDEVEDTAAGEIVGYGMAGKVIADYLGEQYGSDCEVCGLQCRKHPADCAADLTAQVQEFLP